MLIGNHSDSFIATMNLPDARCLPAQIQRCLHPPQPLTSAQMKHQLDFEKPIAELQRKLDELTKHRDTHAIGINFDEEIARMEKKIAETRKQIFTNLTAWQRVQLARHPKRPFSSII
jgi:hypothetical protein